MYMGTVVGTAVATSKVRQLTGQKFLLIRLGPDEQKEKETRYMVAVDPVGAGIGETVLVAVGSAARELEELSGLPVDAAVVGIVNDYDLYEDK